MPDKDSSSAQEATVGVVGKPSVTGMVLSSGKSAKDDRDARKARREKEQREAKKEGEDK